MTSQLSVSTTSPASSSFAQVQSSNSGQSSGGGFGALLDAVGGIGSDIASAVNKLTSPPPQPVQTGFKQVATATAPAPAATSTSSTSTAADGSTTDAAGTPPSLLHDLVNSLTELQNAESSGKPVSPSLIKKVKNAIDAVSNFLAAQQPAALQTAGAAPATDAKGTAAAGGVGAVGNALSALMAGTAATGTATGDGTNGSTNSASTNSAATDGDTASATNMLTQLDGKLQALSQTLSTTAPDISSKLADLAKSLDPSKLSSDTLTQLGLQGTGSAADPKLATALNGFIYGKPQTAPTLQPSLGTAQLKLPSDVALPGTHTSSADGAGKTGESGQNTQANAAHELRTAASAGTNNQGNSSTGDQSKGGGQSAAAATVDLANAVTGQAQDASAASSSTAASPNAAIAPQTVTATTAAPAVQTAYPAAAAAQVNLPQMAYEIAHRAQSGSNQFQIKLDPAEMGRVDVNLAFDSSGAVSAKLTVERPETLALLQRDAGALGQALTQAGLDGSKTSLQFSLSQNPFARQDGGNGNGRGNSGSQTQSDDDMAIDAVGGASVTNLYRGTATPSGLNIVV